MTRLGMVLCLGLAPLAACSSVAADPYGGGGFGGVGDSGRGSLGGQGSGLSCGPGGAIAPAAVFRPPSGNACSGAPTRLPRVRTGVAAAAADDGRIYLVGGWSDVNTSCQTPTLVVYDPSTNEYRRLAEPPETFRGTTGAAVVGTTLVAFSGTPWRYDIPTDTWTAARAPIDDLWFDAAAVSGGDSKAYFFGGLMGGIGSGMGAKAYDPASDQWEALPPIPQDMYEPSAVAMAGKFYVASRGRVAIFDRQASAWTMIGSPTYRGNARLAADGAGHLLYMGGDGSGLASSVDSYDPATGVWAKAAPMPSASMLMGVASACGDRVFVFGGQGDDYVHFPSNGINDLVQVYAGGAWQLSP
jgi:hypothetical protein